MKLLKSDEMQRLDDISINKIGIPGSVLMENAGRAVAEFIKENWPPPCCVYIFCGSGNNGGDGLVVARHLYNKGYNLRVFLTGVKEKIAQDAAINLKIASNVGISIEEITSSEHLPAREKKSGREEVLLVDALLGTGAKGAPRGIFAQIIELINGWEAVKIAVDLPSGVDADTGEVVGKAVKADWTVTFAYPKRGLYLYPGIDYSGKVRVVDIGIPSDIIEREKIHIPANLLLSEDFPPRLFHRCASSHKGTFGHLFVLAGSCGLTGAATLTCMGSLRVGTGLVTLGIPVSLNSIMEAKLTEVMTLPLSETDKKALSCEAFKEISHFASKCQALIVGPGLSRSPQTQELIRQILRSFKLPLVLDADGINALTGDLGIISNYEGAMVITPHPGELARFVGTSVAQVQKDRIKAALALASGTGKVVVLKGAGTVIASPQGLCWVNTTGNAGMASGGTGDVLTGVIGGFLAQGMDVLTSAKLGVYLHGLAADLAVKKQGGLTLLIAQDIIENLVFAIRSLNNEYY
ncbi:NAD(P)H-hydrate dehydratase [Candidatus Aerophobetes bacterium]|nr:NAD(P)H-hydrate dehydratase [Candidatus Aerophobetes bacterium]